MTTQQAVRKLREAYDEESQQDFSNRLGVAMNTVARYERGESNPTPIVLVKLGALARAKGKMDLYKVFALGTDVEVDLEKQAQGPLVCLDGFLVKIQARLTELMASPAVRALPDHERGLIEKANVLAMEAGKFIRQLTSA